MQFDELLDHPGYNHEYGLAGMMFARKIAETEGLAAEVTSTYWGFVKGAFIRGEYPFTRQHYFVLAQDALHEWDI